MRHRPVGRDIVLSAGRRRFTMSAHTHHAAAHEEHHSYHADRAYERYHE